MALAAGDILRTTWRFSGYNQEFQFQQHYRVLTAPGASGTLATLFAISSYFTGDPLFGGPSSLTTAWLNMLGSGVQLYGVDTQRITPTKTIYVRKETAQAGTGGTGSKATNTAAVFSLVSGVPGRSQIAKYHIGPLPDAFMVQGALSSGALTNLRALAQTAILTQTLDTAAVGDTTLQPVIFHRNVNANPRYADVATYRINFFVRTQRRRTIAVGK